MGSNTNEALARREFTRVKAASVKRILKEIVGIEPDLIRAAIIDGLSAPPPRSFPYIALAAAYLDGKPIDAEPPIQAIADLSELTNEQLRERAALLAAHFRGEVQEEGVIDVVPEVVK